MLRLKSFFFSLLFALLLAMPAATQTVRLVPEETDRILRAMTPKTDDDDINKIVQDPRTIFYYRAVMPLIYWQNGTFRHGGYDIGPSGAASPHNGARAFPWDGPGGVDELVTRGGESRMPRGVSTLKFLWLPPGRPIVWYYARRFEYNTLTGNGPDGSYVGTYPRWVYPMGTVFGEVLILRGEDGHDYPFEIRIRVKEQDEWGVDIFRPARDADDLVSKLPHSEDGMRKHLLGKGDVRVGKLRDPYPHAVAIDASGSLDYLPAFAEHRSVAKILSRRFTSTLGYDWRDSAVGMSAMARPNIVPVGYSGTLLGSDRYDCARCHESTGVDVSKFHIGRDWYSGVRGSDRILSFEIADPELLVKDASPGPWRVRPALGPIVKYVEALEGTGYVDTAPGK